MKKISKFITNHSFFIVVLSLLLLIPATIGFIKTKVNYDILVYLPDDIETVKGQNILTNNFNIGAFSFVMIDNMSNYDILNVEKEIQKIDGVNQVLSIADITDTTIPIEMLPDDVINKVYNKEKTVIVVTFQNSISAENTIDAVRQIRTTIKSKESVSGMTAMVLDTMDLSNKEVTAYIMIAVSLCILVLILATDSYLVPFLLLGNIGVAILYNMGTNIFLGQISYITKAISAVLQLGVTTDFSIFLYHKFEQEKELYPEKSKKENMAEAISATFKSVFGSSLTTIIGFLALCSMNLKLGSDIGIVMAKGVFCGLVCVLSLFPALLLVFDHSIQKTMHKNYFPKMKGIQTFSIKHYKLILVAFLLLLGPAIYGNNRVEVYYKLDKSLPKDLASSIANSKLAEEFNIVSPQIILINKDLKSNQLNELVNKLKSTDGIDLVLAPNSLNNFGMSLEMIPEDLHSLIENDQYQLIILNSTYEIASDQISTQIDRINKLVKSYDKNAIIAGEGPLMKDLTEIADHDFKMVNFTSIIIIFLLMTIILKSLSLPIILVCTIEFAIFINMAISYYTGVTLPFIASIVIGTIQLGATIDYAILMSTTYLEERLKVPDKILAIKETLSKTTTSIIVSALCFFAATFGVAIYSKIDMIGSICNLLSRGALISMVVVTIVLPSLLIIFDKVILKTTYGMKKGNVK